ncbi:hypothetical protein ElyMa_006516200 [Elysia marginata]|uniref:Uncharacterized protein n=1 Tax=Elysia marginata TaxID=1093978 RepID=A0AAV4I6P3_9GAST|nr:hypothetical protein ElyMa_006516200 [Elysia marginata]
MERHGGVDREQSIKLQQEDPRKWMLEELRGEEGKLFPSRRRGASCIVDTWILDVIYAEAVPLRKIDTETVAEALVDIYSRLGVPEEPEVKTSYEYVLNLRERLDDTLKNNSQRT